MAKVDHSLHRQRVKERFLENKTFEGFASHEIVEMLLFYALPRKNTNEVAHELMNRFGSISGILDAPYEELKKIDGIADHTATFFKMLLPLGRIYNIDKFEKKPLLNSTNLVNKFLLGRYLGYTDEVFSMISLDNCGRLISYDILTKGSNNFVTADTRKVVETAIKTGASQVIIAHNHPGGFAIPSDSDIMATELVKLACSSININLLDHFIIAGDDSVSMRDSGNFTKIWKEQKY